MMPTFLPDGSCLTPDNYYDVGLTEALLYYFSTTANDKVVEFVLDGRVDSRVRKGIPSIFD